LAGKRIVIFGWAHSVHIQRWVSGLTKRGYRIKVISLDGAPLPDIDTCILTRRGRWSYFTQASKAAHEASAFKPHLVHVHYAAGFGLWGLRLKFVPTVVSVWGADIIDFPTNWLFRSLIRRVLQKATHVTATSNFLRDAALRLDPVTAQKITVIPFGVAVSAEIVPPPPTPPVKLCYIKAHRPKYGPDILLRALAQVKNVGPELSLSLAGEGELTPHLKRLTSELGLTEKVKFVGFIPNTSIYEFVQQHHIMVMPSVMDSESFGVAALEASACGRPVIASRVGGVPEVVLHRKTGILVPPKDPQKLAEAIINLAQDAKTREEMGQAGYRFVKENYSWEKSLDMMGELYERLIHEAAKRT
jgi:glycosyltransferase involved in cell wall biosynthesis